jgi:hypothetical protein
LLQVTSISQLTVSRLSRQCGILNISQPYRLPLPVTGIADQMSRSFPSNRGSSTCSRYTVGGKISDKNLEQEINTKFCVKIGKSASGTLALLSLAYGEYAMKKSNGFEWHRRTKEGRDVQGDPRSGQPKLQGTDANANRVRTLVRPDRR